MFRFAFAVALSLVACLTTRAAQSASLTGDDLVNFQLVPTIGNTTAASSAVVSGVDLNIFNALQIDFDGGSSRDIFSIRCCGPFSAIGYGDTQSSTTINLILSDLDFDQPFVGVTFFTNIVNAQVSAITARSITLTWQDGIFLPGEHLSFRFDSAPVSQVPLPAALPMLAPGLGGLALLGRRGRV